MVYFELVSTYGAKYKLMNISQHYKKYFFYDWKSVVTINIS